MKLCKDCKHWEFLKCLDGLGYGLCWNSQTIPVSIFASYLRKEEQYCGPEAKHWEAKE